MATKQKNFAFLPLIIVICVFLSLFSVGTYAYVRAKHRQTCEVTEAMKRSSSYDVPCEISITFKSSARPNQQRVNELVNYVHGTVYDPSPNIGVYFIKVPPGTEDKAIAYLKSQPDVETATHNYCCYVAD